MSDYAVAPGGSLKFKGLDIKKKKKKKSSSSATASVKESSVSIAESSKSREKTKATVRDESNEADKRKRRSSDSEDEERQEDEEKSSKSGGRQITEAERKFEEVQRKRRVERVAKTANMSHKDRVTEFNSKLDKLTEHNDIPKISWTG